MMSLNMREKNLDLNKEIFRFIDIAFDNRDMVKKTKARYLNQISIDKETRREIWTQLVLADRKDMEDHEY